MSNLTGDSDEAEAERESAALDAEFARVGVTWGALRAELARRAAAARGDGERGPAPGLMLQVGPMLAALRQLPDGAGAGPVADWVCGTRLWRALLRARPDREPDA